MDFSLSSTVWLVGVGAVAVLLALLLVSLLSRPRVFCQYLEYMTGIKLKPSVVRRVFHENGRGGVRDHLISLLIQEDLADTSRRVTPDSKPDTSLFDHPL